MARPWIVLTTQTIRRCIFVVVPVVIVLSFGFFTRVNAPGTEMPPPPLLDRRIVIDPGHGGVDPGCHIGPWQEKDIVLQLAFLLADELSHRGAHVLLTRNDDASLDRFNTEEATRHRRDLAARLHMADEYGGEIFVSLHVNVARSTQLSGAMIFFHRSDREGEQLARALLPHVAQIVPGNQNSVLPANFYLLRHARLPSALIEIGFLSHPQDRQIITDATGLDQMSQAIARGIEAYMTRQSSEDEKIQDVAISSRLMEGPNSDEHACFLWLTS